MYNAINETDMKTFQTIEAAANLKGMAKHTYNRVMSAMAEDTTPAMLHAFTALTDGVKAIVLASGRISNAYIRGTLKSVAADEAATELEDAAAVLVSRNLRKIDHICAVAFLAEYISRQRKAIETPETPNPDNTPRPLNANETISNTPANLAKLHALAVNGSPMFYIWLDAVDDAATTSVYLTESAARADIARLEADDKEAGIYEPDAYRIINAAPYFS